MLVVAEGAHVNKGSMLLQVQVVMEATVVL
jgi:hypothetical protein